MNKIGIVGAGWRAEMWISVIQKLKDVSVAGVLCRREARAAELSARYGVATVRDVAALDVLGCDAVLVCVSKQSNCSVSEELLSRGLRVLSETPAGMTAQERARLTQYGADVLQFAEQFPLQPRFAALRSCLERGLIGDVHTVSLSCCHGYHAVALMRALLGTGEAVPAVRAVQIDDPYAETQWRGIPRDGAVHGHDRVLALLAFGGRTALYDFSHAQYFSPVRRTRVLVQGTLGEMSPSGGVRLVGGEAAEFSLHAQYGGQGCDLGAPDLISVSLGGEPVYRNAFYGLRLSEEEIAMASALRRALAAFEGREKGYPASAAALDASIADEIKRSISEQKAE